MSDRTGLGGSPVAIFAVVWIVAAALLVGGVLDAGPGETAITPSPAATPAPNPVPLPAAVEFGEAVDEVSGGVTEPQQQFFAGGTLAFSAWLGTPVEASEVFLEIYLLRPDGGNELVWDNRPLPVDPARFFISATYTTDQLIEELGRGSFRLRIIEPPELALAIGTFQLDVAEPSAITAFPDVRPIVVAAGEQTFYRFDVSGSVVEERTEAIGEDTTASAARRAVYAGEPYVYLVGNTGDGYWISESVVSYVEVDEPETG